MDHRHFDQITRALAAPGSRRHLLAALAALPVVGGLIGILDADDAESKGRRKRRKKAHKHGKGRRRKGNKKKPCKSQPASETCTGKCGSVSNNCKKTVDCGPCACNPPCGACQTCSSASVCEACEPCCDDVCCTQAAAICHTESGACCVPDSHARTCDGQCGDIQNNCGVVEDCGPCLCPAPCPACQVCDEETGDCVPDQSQEGDDCGEAGQVCQANGSCACDAGSCPSCTTCKNNGLCETCANCCDANGDCQDGDTDTACGSSGLCDVCTGQEECQGKTCVCVPDCDGKICGNDGCSSTCAPGCGPNSTCTDGGTRCECDFLTCADSCCADGQICCQDTCVTGACCSNAQCSGVTPVCGDAHTCVACQTHAQCGAGFLCLSDGSCQACDVCGSGCAYSTVQAAVADSGGPSTISICPGTNTETITIGRAVTLIGAGQGSGNSDTILKGAGGRVVQIPSETGAVTLRQMRITGGAIASAGGGVHHQGTTLTMTDCTVTENSVSLGAPGGGIACTGGSSLFMTNCTVTKNHAGVTSGSGMGGGLYITGPATLTTCTIFGNSALYTGGGITMQNNAKLTLDGSTVTGNSAGLSGGGVRAYSGTVTLINGASITGNNPDNCVGNSVPGCND
jgi:hypothetical protein